MDDGKDGSRGCTNKWAGPHEIAAGVLRPDAVRVMFHETAGGEPAPASPPDLALTSRETAVQGLLAQGIRPAEVTARLVISAHTVRKHIGNASEKLHSPGVAGCPELLHFRYSPD